MAPADGPAEPPGTWHRRPASGPWADRGAAAGASGGPACRSKDKVSYRVEVQLRVEDSGQLARNMSDVRYDADDDSSHQAMFRFVR